jgi:hypothetical protein
MTLKVIGAGFGRTGTMSLYTALNELGLPCYHMKEVMLNKANKSHLDFWWRVSNTPAGTQHDWQHALAKYQATVDNPTCCVWRELLAAYPDAKVVLTTHPRGADAWFDSTLDTIYFTETMWQFKVLELLTPLGKKFGGLSRELIWRRALQGTMNDRANAIARYHQHIAEVQAAVPPERLLVYSVDQGWAPLCAFLGIPEPRTSFPNVNDRAEVKKTINGVIAGTYALLGLSVLAVTAVVYGVTRWLL